MIENERPALVWTEGKILSINELSIPATDRALEHGLGLFETMRAKTGSVPLWGLHKQRLLRSAKDLGLKVKSSRLPNVVHLRNLLEESGFARKDARLRLTLSGGSGKDPGRLWVAAYPLPPIKLDNLILADKLWPVDERDPLVAYKTLNYWLRRRAHDEALAQGADEALSQGFKKQIWEGSRTSLFLVKNEQVIAPPRDGARLRSISEEVLAELARTSVSLELVYRPVTEALLAGADEVILTNALRGVMTVSRWRNSSYPSPGPMATKLRLLWQVKYF